MTLSDWLGAASVLLALVGIPLTWVLARRSRRLPKLQYAVDFDVLADPADGLVNAGLSMKFRGSDVERVSRTYLAFWNRSGDTVDRSHVLDHDPLRVVLGAGDVPLQTRVVNRSRQQNELASRIENDQVLIDFLFLDAGDGGIVEILHQGAVPPVMAGTVKGARLERVGGRLDLSGARIDWMAQRGILNRIRYRIKSSAAYTSRRRRLSLLVPVIAMAILTVAVVVAVASQLLRTPHLVDVNQYNLTTLQGQHAFSSKVQDIGQTSGDEPVLLALLVLQAIAMTGLLASTFWGRRYIPRSIVAESVQTTTAVASEGADSSEVVAVAANTANKS